ncbi:MAG: DUF302 domain-containing protein [Candidatus Zixiibacteriota bacterium]
MAGFGKEIRVKGSFEEIKAKVVNALKTQGFGILTEIDVQKTLKEKIDVEFEPYQILGACNPQLAYQALQADKLIGLLLPCNIVIREVGESVAVSILDPEVMFSVVSPETKSALAALPGEAKNRLWAALALIGSSSS